MATLCLKCVKDVPTMVVCTGNDRQSACRHVLEGHGGWVSAGASCLSPSMMVTAGGDNLSVVWNTETGACVNVLQGHSAPVTCVTLTRKGR